MNFDERIDNISRLRKIRFIEIRTSEVDNPFFSIVIPTYKRAGDLKNAIEAAIDQDCIIPYEIIVVDNNPERNDDTEMIIEGINCEGLSYLKNEENVGMVGNWNRCLMVARGEWVVFCHDDDVLEKTALSAINQMIRKNPDCHAVTSRLQQKNSPYIPGDPRDNSSLSGRIKRVVGAVMKCFIRTGLPISANLFCDNIYGPPTCGLSVKRDTMMGFGGWRDGYIISDWITMISYAGKYKVVRNKSLTGTYIWKQNTSLNPEAIEIMTREKREILRSLPKASVLCLLYTKLLGKDFKRKEKERIGDYNGKRSIAYKLIRSYYNLRIR